MDVWLTWDGKTLSIFKEARPRLLNGTWRGHKPALLEVAVESLQKTAPSFFRLGENKSVQGQT